MLWERQRSFSEEIISIDNFYKPPNFPYKMLYIIGLGLNVKGITKEGLDAIKRCKKVYLENYTVDFPYTIHQLNLEL